MDLLSGRKTDADDISKVQAGAARRPDEAKIKQLRSCFFFLGPANPPTVYPKDALKRSLLDRQKQCWIETVSLHSTENLCAKANRAAETVIDSFS